MPDDVSLVRVGDAPAGAIVDIVFVHGLGGNARDTWMIADQPDTFWPRWVRDNFANSTVPCDVWTLHYPANATRWTGGGDAMELPTRAKSVLSYLAATRIGKRPVIFIAHSLGGLLVKYVLRISNENRQGPLGELAQRTQAVIFMATPHRGSALADVLERIPLAGATAATRDLVANSEYLREIDDWYRANTGPLQIDTFAVCENRKVRLKWFRQLFGLPVLVVDPSSADPNIANCRTITIDADHIQICKPKDRQAAVYINVKAFLEQTLLHASSKVRTTRQDLSAFLGGVAHEDQTCYCILSAFKGSHTTYKTTDKQTLEFCGPTVSPEDTAAAVYLCSLAARVRSFTALKVMSTDQVRDEDRENNLLLVGSSLTNAQTDWALSLDGARYRFISEGDIHFRIECSACKHHARPLRWLPNDGDTTVDKGYSPGKATTIDYAMLQRLKWNGFDIFVLAGLGPVGTRGAAYYMLQNWYKLYATYRSQPFGVILQFGKYQHAATYNDPTVIHRTDPDHPDCCLNSPLE